MRKVIALVPLAILLVANLVSSRVYLVSGRAFDRLFMWAYRG